MEKLTPEYKLFDGRLLKTSPLLDNLVFPNEFYSKDFKEKHINHEDILDEIFSRWLLDEKEYHFTLTEEETENVPTHIEIEVKSIFSELITYIDSNYLSLPKSLDFSFEFSNGTYIDANKFAPSIEFFKNHMFYHSYGDEKIVIDKIFEFILENNQEIILESEELKSDRYCVHCGNDDIDLITTFRFYFSGLNGKIKDLNYVKNEFKPVIEDSYIKHCNQREDWIDFVGKDSAKEIGDFLVLDYCEKCSHWSLDDEDFVNVGGKENAEPKETILYIADGVDGLDQLEDSNEDEEDEWDFEDEEDEESEYEKIIKYSEENTEEIYIKGQRILKAKDEKYLPIRFITNKNNSIKVLPSEMLLWNIEGKDSVYRSENDIKIYHGVSDINKRLASLDDIDLRFLTYPSFIKTSDGVFFKSDFSVVWKMDDNACLYLPPLNITKIKVISKDKEFHYGPLSRTEKPIRLVVHFKIFDFEFKTGVEFLPRVDAWRLYTSPIKCIIGICPFCKEECSTLAINKSKSHCPYLRKKLFNEVIIDQIKDDKILKDTLSELLENFDTIDVFDVKVENISIKKYMYLSHAPKWKLAISYDVYINGKKHKKNSQCVFTKGGWQFTILGDLNFDIKNKIEKQLISSEILTNFVEQKIKEKEKNAERPQIQILRIRRPNKQIIEGIKIDFAMDFKLIYEAKTLICIYERYKYLNSPTMEFRDYIEERNYEKIEKTFLGFDDYIYEQIKSEAIVKEILGEI